MVAPLIVAGARLAGTQLAKQGAARAAGAQLAKREASQVAGNQLVKNAPQIARKPLNSAPTQMRGPVYGYSEPKVVQSDIDVIKDWQGLTDDKKQNNANKAGELLNTQNIKQVPRTSIQEEESNESVPSSVEMEYFDAMPGYTPEPIRQIAEEREKLGGPGYWLVLVIVAVKDTIDVIFEILGFVLDIFIITAPFGMVIEIIDWILDFIVLVSTQTFFLMNGVKMNTKKWTFQGVTTSIEAIPVIGALPFGTISFVFQAMQINKERKAEEEAEQASFDEQYENEMKEYYSMIEEQNKTYSSQVRVAEEESEGRVNNKKGTEWEEMVEQSDLNITR